MKKRGEALAAHSATDTERVFAEGIENTDGFGKVVGVNGIIWFNGRLCLVCARTKAAFNRQRRVSGSINQWLLIQIVLHNLACHHPRGSRLGCVGSGSTRRRLWALFYANRVELGSSSNKY